MQALKVNFQFKEKDGFTEIRLKDAIIKNLAEIGLSLLSFNYQKDGYTVTDDLLPIKIVYSVCECLIEYKSFGPLPSYQIILGGIQTIPQEYPYFDIQGIDTPSVVEIK